MKLQYKSAAIMTLFGIVIVALLSWGYDIQNHRVVIDKELHKINFIADEVALHLESHLHENVKIATTLSSAQLIKNALLKSNGEFDPLPADVRKEKIAELNRLWMEKEDINDPFIQTRMTNPVAEYLKLQQEIMPGMYGELFLTNRHGVMIATSGKLSTLAHEHKYWWQASHNNGQGRVFLDDRGFDTSVQGYVLGVVVPIFDGNEIIGILKCNVNILGPLSDVVREFGQRNPGQMKIVRTGGLIVAEHDVAPLSTRVKPALIDFLHKKENGTTIIEDSNEHQLVAFSSIPITMGSEDIGFGGSQESLDHIMGNMGEGWHVVICLPEAFAIADAHATTRLILLAGLLFTSLAGIVAMFLGYWAAKPIVSLAQTAQRLGAGHLETRAEVSSNDEIGSLAHSLNQMARNLHNSMTSRDELLQEVERRKKVEETLHRIATTDELTRAYNRRAFNTHLHTNIGRAQRYHEPLSLLILDIDHFKIINDSHGHDVGDLVLKSLVQVLNKSIRQEDILARWGGEEFSLLLPQTAKEPALLLAERLRKTVSDHDFPKSLHITVSIGCASIHDDETSDSLVKRADIALYQAKEAGRDRVEFNRS